MLLLHLFVLALLLSALLELPRGKQPVVLVIVCCCASSPDGAKSRFLLFTAGVLLNMTALVLFGVSSSSGLNAFVPAAILMGLGNITFHLAQFHISALFPRSRGLVASIFVAGFTGCGIIMYLLMLIFESAGGTRCAPLKAQSGHGLFARL